MSFSDRFELLDPLRGTTHVQTFRARERSTGHAVEAHFAASPEILANLDPQSGSVIDRGTHDGKSYVVTAPALSEAAPLDSAGAWRIKPSAPEAAPQGPSATPGDFTRMFQMRQAPEPVAMPASKPVNRAPVAASEPGQFTRAFERPASAPSAAKAGTPVAGEPGEFTRMFQTPAAPPAQSIPPVPVPVAIPDVPEVSSQPVEARTAGTRPRASVGLIVAIIAVLSAIVVFVVMRRLY